MGPVAAFILTGSLVIEQAFSLPGLGRQFITAIDRDYTLLMGTTIILLILVILLNFLIDLSYFWLDPRIRRRAGVSMNLLNPQRAEALLTASLSSVQSRSLTQLAIARFLRNRIAVSALGVLLVLVLLAIFAPFFEWLTGYDMAYQDRDFYSGQPPNWSARHFLGTDQNGRDIFVRTLFGMRISLMVALIAAVVALTVGVLYGTISGLAGGRVDAIMMRILDLLIGYPLTLIAVIALAYFGRNIFIVFAIIGLVEWQVMARVIRGQVQSLRHSDFIEAARATGVPAWGILLRHIIPNIAGVAMIAYDAGDPEVLIGAFWATWGWACKNPTPRSAL